MQVTEKKTPPKLPRIRDLDFSPTVNPLMEPREIALKKRHVRTGLKTDLRDDKTGEITHAAVLHEVQEKDDAEFVKVYAAGAAAMFELGRTAHRVFMALLEAYQAEPMQNGYADSIYLVWFDGGLSGKRIGMSEATFNRGLRELLAKGFLSPKLPNVYWVNPSLFFKGNRVLFLKEYVRRKSSDDQAKREALEARGQMRIDEA
jgi:hypothetical protein